ncbi:MAG TPA: hypothetical protein VFR26_07715 [Acidimicrobiales bacterium]|nr:hypothetical protein [Acidimicrobiales bacterium]
MAQPRYCGIGHSPYFGVVPSPDTALVVRRTTRCGAGAGRGW